MQLLGGGLQERHQDRDQQDLEAQDKGRCHGFSRNGIRSESTIVVAFQWMPEGAAVSLTAGLGEGPVKTHYR